MSDGAQAGQHQGRTVGGGRYRLGGLLGAGGMASVHLAHDSVLDRQVAVKTLHTELGREDSFRERFRREAQSVAKLTHTNIVSVFDTGEDQVDGAVVPYIVMEYVEGKPLRTVLDEDVAQYGAMPTEKALKITADVLAALEVSHEMGLVHRDIKPGNVMVTRRGVVKVMDFGIARAMQSGVTSMTQTGMVVGTPQYLSPEQALGRGVDARSDLYSVGIMLFELLTGRLPFDADSPLAIAYAHVQEEPVAPSSINQTVPAAVDALVARTLRKNPNERFSGAEAMREECERISGSGAAAGASPLIISGGPPARSGSGVSQAVFPAAAPGVPPAAGAQQPYQGHYLGFPPNPAQGGPSSPTPLRPGYATPTPAGYAAGQGGTMTPPPYPMAPSVPSRGNTSVVVGSVIAVIVVVTAIVIAIGLSGGEGGGAEDVADDQTTSGVRTDGAETPDPDEGVEGFKGEDKTKTIDVTRCTEARPHYSDKSKLRMPSFYLKNLESVKKCLDEAGWKYQIAQEDENLWGKNTVLGQTPKEYDPFDPEAMTVNLTVSTGKPA